MRAWIAGLCVLPLLWCVPAQAQAQVSQERALALEGQLRDWLAAVLGPRVELGERPVRLSAEDGRYALELPVMHAGTLALDGPPLTAVLRPLDAGRWALDEVKLPSPLHIATELPGGATADWTVTLTGQQAHAIIDPSLATTSTWDAETSASDLVSHSPARQRHNSAGPAVSHVVWQPAGEGRVDLTAESSGRDLAGASVLPDGRAVTFAAARWHLSSHMDALKPTSLPPLLRAALALGPLGQALREVAPAGATPARSAFVAAANNLLDGMRDLMGGFAEVTEIDDARMIAGPMEAVLHRMLFGARMAAPDGRLALRFDLGLDGIDSPSLPPGPLHTYLPRHIALSPRAGGVKTADVTDMLQAMAAGTDPQPAVTRMLEDGPLLLGIDNLAADFGPASLAGSGELRVAAPDSVSGQARITMTGLDALIRDARSVPMLKQALPMLIFLKGIGEPQGAATVWLITYGDHHVSINGTDLSQMLPGMK